MQQILAGHSWYFGVDWLYVGLGWPHLGQLGSPPCVRSLPSRQSFQREGRSGPRLPGMFIIRAHSTLLFWSKPVTRPANHQRWGNRPQSLLCEAAGPHGRGRIQGEVAGQGSARKNPRSLLRDASVWRTKLRSHWQNEQQQQKKQIRVERSAFEVPPCHLLPSEKKVI